MNNVPDTVLRQITWFETHIPSWQATPEAFGLDSAIVAELDAATKDARAAFNAAKVARTLAKSATVGQDQAAAVMSGLGRDVVNIAKAFISSSGNVSLWGQAGLAPRSNSGTAQAPVAPSRLAATLDSQGTINLSWKASQPRGISGVVYMVRRSIDGGPFVLIDTVGGKKFSDTDVRSGVRSVAYTLQAKRGTQSSALSQSLEIRLGRAGGESVKGTKTTPGGEVKIAA